MPTNLLDLLGHSKLDGVRNEFRVLLDDLLNFLLLKVLELVLFNVETQLGTAAERGVDSVCSQLPNILLAVVVFRGDPGHVRR